MTLPNDEAPPAAVEAVSYYLVRHSARLVIAALAVTGLLVVPYLLLSPEQDASSNPTGQVFDLQDDVDERFQSQIHVTTFIAESQSGDILTQAGLWDLFQRTQALREADQRGELSPPDLPVQPYLYRSFIMEANREYIGVASIADLVQLVLTTDPRFGGVSLADATDEQVKLAVYAVLTDPATSGIMDSLSAERSKKACQIAGLQIQCWTSPAVLFEVRADNQKLGGGTLRIGLGSDEVTLNKERFARNAQRVLRDGGEDIRVWGIAIDVGLESQDEGAIAGTFIMFTVIAAVLVVGISLRSYWAMTLTGVGLGVLMIWLKGISNLAQLKGGLIIELIVPIAMISLGVDFAVHALKRYEEEKRPGTGHGRALVLGFTGVLGALALAMLSDGVAFLANVPSGIEGVIHFGIAAAIAVASSFVILGVIVPLAMLEIDKISVPRTTPRSLASRANLAVSGVGVAVLSGTAVIFMVAQGVIPRGFELVILAATITGFIAIPMLVMRRRKRTAADQHLLPLSSGAPPLPSGALRQAQDGGGAPSSLAGALRRDSGQAGRGEGVLTWLVIAAARYRYAVLPLAAAVTAVAAIYALRLQTTFAAKDFLDSRSDFVVSLDKDDRHVGKRGGEPGIVYLRGDLADPRSLQAIGRFMARVRDNPYIAHLEDGSPATFPHVLTIVNRMTRNDYARQQAASAAGVGIVDADGDGVPDTREGVGAVLDYAVANGVPAGPSTLVLNPSQVREAISYAPGGGEEDVAIIQLGILGTRRQEAVKAAQEALAADMKIFDGVESISFAGLTGSPFTRQAQLESTTRTLQRSIPIAAAGALVLLLVVMRSARYAVVTIIPIGLVVAWLYGIMYVGGFAFNFVTATIGAVSIGVGIDYSIHMTMRFRQELRGQPSRDEALRRAMGGTGGALMASALSSIVGFAILGFAPMPLFASYGTLTAIMIFLALAASLVVLPSLLMLVTPEKPAAHA